MADNDKKRYFWLKLKKDFFQQHKMKVLKAIPNGRLYALIYLELLAESTSHNGKLRFSEMLPYDSVTLAAVIDEDKDILEKAIAVLEQLELLEILSDKTIYLSDIETMIGSESGQTIRKNLAKSVKITEQLPNDYQKITLDIRDKNIDIRKEEDIKIKELMGIITDRHVEAGLYDTSKAYELTHMVVKVHKKSGGMLSFTKLEECVLKIADNLISNPEGYLYETFIHEGGNYDL